MTTKDYVALAAAIRQTAESMAPLSAGAKYALIECADNIATALKRYNPRFDRGRFSTACGLHAEPAGYAARVRELEGEGLTTSDAQGVADAELLA